MFAVDADVMLPDEVMPLLGHANATAGAKACSDGTRRERTRDRITTAAVDIGIIIVLNRVHQLN